MDIISFFVLTYNRPIDTLEAIKNILFHIERPKSIFLEIIIVNNNSSVDYTEFDEFVKQNQISEVHEIKYIINTNNLGVAGGRNQAMNLAKGSILISLDDDAEFVEKDIIQQVIDLFKKYKDQNVQFLTFKVNELADGSVTVASKSPDRFTKRELFTSYFAGGAHALKKQVLSDIGMYDVTEKYGAEEYDLSYKLLEFGGKIVHTNDISILHKKNIQGRFNYTKQNGNLLKNKVLVAYKFLPKRYFYTHLFFWSLYFLKHTRGNFFALIGYIRTTLKERKKIKQKPISKKTMNYILEIGGRLTY